MTLKEEFATRNFSKLGRDLPGAVEPPPPPLYFRDRQGFPGKLLITSDHRYLRAMVSSISSPLRTFKRDRDDKLHVVGL